jgi:hypothetical protein
VVVRSCKLDDGSGVHQERRIVSIGFFLSHGNAFGNLIKPESGDVDFPPDGGIQIESDVRQLKPILFDQYCVRVQIALC